MQKAPRVSVVVSTRNRPDHAAECIATILANDGPEFELVVVDQSDDSGTEAALARYVNDPRLRYVRTEGRGLSVGRNLGIELASGEIVAFTDDDCRVAKNWIQRLAAVFAADPETSGVFGRVRIPEGTFQSGGHAAHFEPVHGFIQGSFPSPGTEIGIGANMAFRREVLQQVGPFDPLLGAGAPFQSGEDDDIFFRVLRAGLKVACAPEPEVLHLGVRKGGEIRSLFAGYHLGLGAALYKHVRLGDLEGIRSYLSWLGYFLAICAKNLMRGVKPIGIRMTLNYLRGAALSYRYGLDRGRRIYVERGRRGRRNGGPLKVSTGLRPNQHSPGTDRQVAR